MCKDVIFSKCAVTIPVVVTPSETVVAIPTDPIKSINPIDSVPIPEPETNLLLITFKL